ncbi:hypothetical protein CSOJ01_11605 [Colletotrichum sojae]|uniref:F-box domain-containing protein n=1 Tax=Colletotrichum sojae TaxID=2175907 RepID=A0A8H6IX00_9PEZI|nr:hypothetical protein CSOJ01_11605 [Colletotrichum sojae]
MSGSWAADTLHDLGLEDVALDEVTPASIEGLPEPLIHQIASLCYVGDIYSLSRVSRGLYRTCNTYYVFQAHFCYQTPIPHPKALARRINQSIDTYYPRAYYYKDLHRKARAVWGHIAVMASKLPGLACELNRRMIQYQDVWVDSNVNARVYSPTKAFRTLAEPVEDIIATFSTFAAFGCLPVLDLSFASVMPRVAITVTEDYCQQTRLGIKDQRLDVNTRKAAFCLALGLLHAPVQDYTNQIRFYLQWMARPITGYLVGSAPDPEYKYDRAACSDKILESWERRQIFALLTHSLMMHMMANTITDRPASEYLPPSTRLPMASPKNDATLPLPRGKLPSEAPRRANTFSSFQVWDTWYRAQVRELAAEIDRGEWVGCILVTAGDLNFGSISPIQKVRFELGPKCESVSGDAIKIRAYNFTDCATPTSYNSLYGTFRRQLDCLSMKFMDSEVGLVGWITPMGIAGVVDFERLRPEAGGYFWLWKREWGGGFVDVGTIKVPSDVLDCFPR